MNSMQLKDRWNRYKKNFAYADGIEFDDIVNCLEIMIKEFSFKEE